jgi:hypothetical protein
MYQDEDVFGDKLDLSSNSKSAVEPVDSLLSEGGLGSAGGVCS